MLGEIWREWEGGAEGERGIGGVETVGGNGSETGSLMKKKGTRKSTTGVGVSLTLDSTDTGEQRLVCSNESKKNGLSVKSPSARTCLCL